MMMVWLVHSDNGHIIKKEQEPKPRQIKNIRSPLRRKGIPTRNHPPLAKKCGWRLPRKRPTGSIAKKKMQKYLIVSQPRSGSTWFGTRIGSHPCITYRHELGHQIWMAKNQKKYGEYCFDSYFKDGLAEAVASSQIIGNNDSNQSCVSKQIGVGGKIWGSQLLLPQNTNRSIPQSILHYLAKNNVKLLLLERTNIIDKMISSMEVSDNTNKFGMHCRIQANNQTSCGKNAADVVQNPVDINLSTLKQLVATSEQNRRFLFDSLNSAHLNYLYLTYEQLRFNPILFAQVVEFLGFPRTDARFLQDRLVKRITKPRKQLIKNYPQVRAELAAIGHLDWLLEEEYA